MYGCVSTNLGHMQQIYKHTHTGTDVHICGGAWQLICAVDAGRYQHLQANATYSGVSVPNVVSASIPVSLVLMCIVAA